MKLSSFVSKLAVGELRREDDDDIPDEPIETIEEEIQEEFQNDVSFTDDDDDEVLMETPDSVFGDLESDDDL